MSEELMTIRNAIRAALTPFMARTLVFLLFAVTAANTSASSASFDCKKVKTDVEKAICADTELSRLDEELGRAYRKAYAGATVTDKTQLGRDQSNWLKNRNNICDSIPGLGRMEPDRECLKTAYEYRIWKLAPVRDESDPLRAGHYRVGWGWDVPLCRELAANLNRHPEWQPLACGMRVDASDPDFALPAWEVLDIRQHHDILKTIWDAERTPVSLPPQEESDRIFEGRFAAGSFKLARAVFGINNSGSPLTVYRAEFSPCDPKIELEFDLPRVPRLYAVGPDGKRPRDDSFIMLTSPPRDVFLYKGRAHLTWWSGHLAQGTATLGVYQNASPRKTDFGAEPICTLGFRE